jgi:very-short-patch-repair endonuclease
LLRAFPSCPAAPIIRTWPRDSSSHERANSARNMADSEKRLWAALRSRRFLGYKFRRQVPIGRFIADFACKSQRVVIEVDGDSHGDDASEARDAERTRWLEAQGWRVMRFWAGDLASMDDVTERIFEVLEGPHPNPLPQSGRGDKAPSPNPVPQGGRGDKAPSPNPVPQGGRGDKAPSP